jgi:prepilin-type N-terminal cleavage/methylation domain-containing protein
MLTKNLKKGFTLIELVVVIAILGILAGIAIPRFMDAQATARGAKILADMRTIDSALTIYQTKTGQEPFLWILTSAGQNSGFDNLTTDNPANGQYKLLASLPYPPTGTVIFPCRPNTKLNIKLAIYVVTCNGSGYEQVATPGRCSLSMSTDAGYIRNLTTEKLAEGGEGW